MGFWQDSQFLTGGRKHSWLNRNPDLSLQIPAFQVFAMIENLLSHP
jgi:hypothetical protein